MVVAGAMWSAPPPLAAVVSTVWAAVHNVLAMAGAIYSHSRVIVEKYPWQCVIALTVMIASCIGTYFARRYVNSRVGDRHSYVQVVPEEVTPRATTPGRRTCAWVGYAILTVIVGLTVMVSAVIAAWAFFLWVPRQYVPALAIAMALGMDAFIAWRYMGRDKAATCRCAVHTLLAALIVMAAVISSAFTVRSASASWSRSPPPLCPRAGHVQSSGAWQAAIGGLVAAGTLYGCYDAFKKAPAAKDRQ